MQYDKEFLLALDKQKNKTIYARIIALDFKESPIETIEGRVTQGSINIDGASAVRRTCSLTLIAQNFDYNNYYWGLNTKFKLEIGVENTINKQYGDIIWFKQGTYLITNFNTANSTNNFTISLQGKDKMCQLNGEVGGSFNSSIDFGTMEEVGADNTTIIKHIPIPEIIRNMIHQYAGEPYHNIIINDLDDLGLELLEYRYDIPMYLYREVGTSDFKNVTLNGNTPCTVLGTDKRETTLSGLNPNNDELDLLVDPLTGSTTPKEIQLDDDKAKKYYVAKVTYGQTAGFRTTDLIYPGDLIANVGDSITSILDKIKNVLGEFEYFYDLDGRFVFQKKQAFVNTLWSGGSHESQQDEDIYVESLALASNTAYTFSEGELISAFNNNPNLLNLRNDFSIWGERTTVQGAAIPIHMRYAIDKKPVYYKSISVQNKDVEEYNKKYGTTLSGQNGREYSIENYDWREIIYQMARDYYRYNFLEDFELRIISANPIHYPLGRTGYESYYMDLYSFWRDLYWPNIDTQEEQKKENYYTDAKEDHLWWNKTVYEAPELLNFWFDFLDVEGELDQFSVKNVGARTKPINDTSIKSIYFRDTPNIIFVDDINITDKKSGYKYIQAKSNINMFTTSSQGVSAKDKLDELIYNHSYCIESATITTIPIYYLQPNTRIYIHDSRTNLDGDYIISKLTIPLTYNGMMTITATKAAETLL